jgi:hypothetical protein
MSSCQGKGNEEMEIVPEAKTLDSRQPSDRHLHGLIVSHSEEIGKLKSRMRKQDLSIDELESYSRYASRSISEMKRKSEKRTE